MGSAASSSTWRARCPDNRGSPARRRHRRRSIRPDQRHDPCSNARSSGSELRPGPRSRSTPTSAVSCRLGDSSPSSDPTSTVARPVREFDEWQVDVMLERGCTVAGGLGLGDPELGAENEIAIGVHLLLGVDDPRAHGHQVQLAGTDDLLIAEAVSVHELTRDQPCHRLEPDVGVRTDGEALTVCGERADVVEETPGADRAPGTPGQQASDRDTGELGAPCGISSGTAVPGSRGLPPRPAPRRPERRSSLG